MSGERCINSMTGDRFIGDGFVRRIPWWNDYDSLPLRHAMGSIGIPGRRLRSSGHSLSMINMEDTSSSFDVDRDPWLAADKLYHFLFCFSLTILFSSLASLSRFPLLRAYSIGLGSLLSLAAGAAKEFADHLGFFRSSGASTRDAVADVLGVFVSAIGLSFWFKCGRRTRDPTRSKRILPL